MRRRNRRSGMRSLSMWHIVAGAAIILFGVERHRALRRPVEPGPHRIARNLAIAALSAVAVQAVERPITVPVAALVERRRWGVVNRLAASELLRRGLAVIALDYTLYLWHVLTHRVPWLWRLHIVHHADLDLDMTTALRFHFTEMLISTCWRVGQILLIGVPRRTLAVWQTLTLLSVLFHHSNLRLPMELERWLRLLIVTPRMHGIHHSIIVKETNSNWSSGLTLWDWLHGTLRLDVPHESITIGVPAVRCYAEVRLGRMLALPFIGQAPSGQPVPTI